MIMIKRVKWRWRDTLLTTDRLNQNKKNNFTIPNRNWLTWTQCLAGWIKWNKMAIQSDYQVSQNSVRGNCSLKFVLCQENVFHAIIPAISCWLLYIFFVFPLYVIASRCVLNQWLSCHQHRHSLHFFVKALFSYIQNQCAFSFPNWKAIKIRLRKQQQVLSSKITLSCWQWDRPMLENTAWRYYVQWDISFRCRKSFYCWIANAESLYPQQWLNGVRVYIIQTQ